jgi:acetyl-CoA carboxylase carboxyl transferase subunit alpha
MDTEALLKHRMLKFRKIGGFQEGVPVDPIKKVNMKKKEEPVAGKTPVIELEYEVEKLKQQISKAKESSSKPTELALNDMIEKLKKDIDLEYSAAVEAMGLKDRFLNLREECLKANSQDQLMHPVLMDRIEKLSDEFNKGLPTAPNYTSLKYKLDMLKEFSIAKSNLEKKGKGEELKLDINKKLKEVMDQPEMKEKMQALKAEVQKSGASSAADLDDGTKESISKMKKEIELELASVLKSMDLNVEIVRAKELIDQDLKAKVESLEEETNKKIENLMKSSDLKNTIKLLKLEMAKAGKTPDAALKNKIEALEQQIKRKLSAAISSSEIKEKHEELQAEIKALEGDGGLNGSLKNDDLKEASSKYDESRV